MELTKQVLTDIVKSLRSNARVGVEKREQPRVGVRLRVHMLRRPFLDPPIHAWVRDVSAGGIGVLADQQFRPKDDVRLVLVDAAAEPVACNITYCRRVAPGQFQIGLKFDATADVFFR